MNYFRRAHSKEVTIFHRRLLFLTQWLSVIYLTIFLFTNYKVLIFSFHKSLAYLAFYIPINQILYICTLSQNLPSKSEGTNFNIFVCMVCILRLEASTFSRPWLQVKLLPFKWKEKCHLLAFLHLLYSSCNNTLLNKNWTTLLLFTINCK